MNYHHYPQSHWSGYITDEAELNMILTDLQNFGGVYEFKDFVPKQPGKPRWRSYLKVKNNSMPVQNAEGPVPLPEALVEDLQ